MKLFLELKEDKKYLEVIRMLSNIRHPNEITPYNKLRNREMEVLAIMYYFYNEKYAHLSEEDKNALIFSYDRRQEIVDRLSEEGSRISKETVYNIMMDLRKKGFIGSKEMIPGKVLPNIKQLTFNFE